MCAIALGLTLATQVRAGNDSKKDPSQIGNRDVGKGVNFYSIEKEIEIGRQLAQEVERQSKLVTDPVITEYVNRVAQNLGRNSDVKVPITAKVIDSREVNAFALPGGFMFVHTGLIERAATEAELAGVLAHEIAHVAARHGTRQATRGELANLASIPLIFMGGGWGGYAAQQAAGLAVPLTFLKFSRNFEREADMLGIQYMYAAGYDPAAFIEFFERLQVEEKKKPGTLSKLFGSHPPTEDRIEEAQKNISAMLPAKPEYMVTSSEFGAAKARLAELLNTRREEQVAENRPKLRRRTDGDARPIEDTESKGEADEAEPDERPTLKRKITS
jgi:predicted Zn-dependent protease